ncbi:MAG: M20/M25/M40 family metallo-hydrolase [Gemmatimonadetes bacterium]|nr:M20/M25/M40 family metallo-hydrolase [Gemmatimonadota bacterium]
MTRKLVWAAAGLLLLAAPSATFAVRAQVVDHPRLQAALDAIRASNDWTLEQQVSICEIEAPPFKEQRRAEEFRRRLVELGLQNVRIDREGNVLGEWLGTAGGPVVVVSAHLDTVFPEGTDVKVKREGTRLRAPGIGDDCRGLAVLLAVVRALLQARVEPRGSVVFAGTVGEEGPGNLRGVRHLFAEELRDEVGYFISIDGTGFGITSRAVGSNRYQVAYRGPGGHSYGAFGMPNPIHALGRALAKVAELQVPAAPKTTFNAGVIRGGTSVNSIAGEASFDMDLRSESPEALRLVDAEFQRAIRSALEEENARWPRSEARLSLKLDTIGIRPAGAQPDSARIVVAARNALQAVGKQSQPTEASSTDSNVPISLGIPAVTIDGGGRGGGAHSLGEWYDDGVDGYVGPQWLAVLVADLAGVRP